METLVAGLVTCSPWHERLPPGCLSEGPCEAVLSCVVTMVRNSSVVELDGIFDILFLSSHDRRCAPVT